MLYSATVHSFSLNSNHFSHLRFFTVCLVTKQTFVNNAFCHLCITNVDPPPEELVVV
jgi:hypothetical protein